MDQRCVLPRLNDAIQERRRRLVVSHKTTMELFHSQQQQQQQSLQQYCWRTTTPNGAAPAHAPEEVCRKPLHENDEGSQDNIQQLGSNVLSGEQWEEFLARLRAFKSKHGHLCVTCAHGDLWEWLKYAKQQYKNFILGLDTSMKQGHLVQVRQLDPSLEVFPLDPEKLKLIDATPDFKESDRVSQALIGSEIACVHSMSESNHNADDLPQPESSSVSPVELDERGCPCPNKVQDEGSFFSDLMSCEPPLADEIDERENERLFMEKLDREIFDAEEIDLMQQIDKSICLAKSKLLKNNVEESSFILAKGGLGTHQSESKSLIRHIAPSDRNEKHKSVDTSPLRDNSSGLTSKKRRRSQVSNSVEESLSSFQPEMQQTMITDGKQSFLDFKRTFWMVAKLEFEPSGINPMFATRQMWKRHQELFGSTCGESCPCISKLDSLTDAVKPNYLSHGKTLPKNAKTTGFASRFAKIVFTRIGHLNRTRHENLERLVSLWEDHKKDPMLGGICGKDCSCANKLAFDVIAPTVESRNTYDENGEPDGKRHKQSTSSIDEITSEVSLQNGIQSVTSHAKPKAMVTKGVPQSVLLAEESRSLNETSVEMTLDGLKPPAETAWATAFKIIPKFLTVQSDKLFISQDELADFNMKLVPKLKDQGLPLEFCQVHAVLENIANDPCSWMLKVSGQSSILDRFLLEFNFWFNGKLIDYNRELLERDGVEIEAKLSASLNLDANIKRPKFDGFRGLSIQLKSEQGQLARTLGPKATLQGAFVTMIDGIACDSMQLAEFSDLKSTKDSMSLTFLLPASADLSGMDASRLVRGPIRRGGEKQSEEGGVLSSDDMTDKRDLELTQPDTTRAEECVGVESQVKSTFQQTKHMVSSDPEDIFCNQDSQKSVGDANTSRKWCESAIDLPTSQITHTKDADCSLSDEPEPPCPLSRGGMTFSSAATITSRRGSFVDLLWLMRHDPQGKNVSTATIELMRACLKSEIELLEGKYNGTSNHVMRLRDLRLRDALLYIYLTATASALFAKSLRHWERCVLRIRKVNFTIYNAFMSRRKLSIDMYADLQSPPKRVKLPPVPDKVMNGEIDYDDSVECEINFNPVACPERAVGLDFWTEHGTQREQIGVARVRWEDLQRDVDTNRKGMSHVSIKILPLYDPLRRRQISHIGTMDISFCRRIVDASELDNEQREVACSIWKILDLMDDFNNALLPGECAEGTLELRDLKVCGGMTLLDIAQTLNDRKLIHKLETMSDNPERQATIVNLPSKPCDVRNGQTPLSNNIPKSTPLLQSQSSICVSDVNPMQYSSPVEKSAKITLPLLGHTDWLVHELGAERFVCRYYNGSKGCLHGRECYLIHVQMPWGQELEKLWKRMDGRGTLPFKREHFLANVRFKEARDSAGKTWVTAGYCNYVGRRIAGQEVMYAEGGNFARVSKQGVSWYTTRDDALKALERVIVVSRWASEHQIKPQAQKHASQQKYIPKAKTAPELKYVPEYVEAANEDGLVTSLTRSSHSKSKAAANERQVSSGIVTRSGRTHRCSEEQESQSVSGKGQVSPTQRKNASKDKRRSRSKKQFHEDGHEDGLTADKNPRHTERYDAPRESYYSRSMNGSHNYGSQSYDRNRRYDSGRSKDSREHDLARSSWSSRDHSKSDQRWNDRNQARRWHNERSR